jgi:glucose-1-phosphate cytidylyltransferase
MKTVILCGGKGSRLKEETEFKPKPLICVGGKPILWHIMKIYSHYGFNDFILALGYKGEMLKDYFLRHKQFCQDFCLNLESQKIDYLDNQTKEDWNIVFADTGEETLTGGRIHKLKKYLENEDRFMVTYGDGLADIDLKKLLDFHQKTARFATITGGHPSSKYGLIETADDRAIVSFRQKPVLGEYVNIGFMIFEKKIFDYLGEDRMIEDIFPKIAQDRQIAMYQHEGFFHAMDTYRDYEDLNKMWEAGNRPWKIWQ